MRLECCISKDNRRSIEFIEMSMRPDFNEAIEKLRQKWKIDTESLSLDSKESEDEWLSFLENSRLRLDVESLLSSLNISSDWEDVIHQYVVDGSGYSHNDVSHQISKNSKGLTLEIDLENLDDMILRIGPETVFNDLKIAWEKIKKYRKVIPPRKRDRDLFLRDYEIFHLAKEGKTIREICNTIENKYYKNKDLDYGNIKKIVSNFYTRLKVPKKDRRKLKT